MSRSRRLEAPDEASPSRAPGQVAGASGRASSGTQGLPGLPFIVLVAAPLLFHWRLLVPGAGRHYFVQGDFVDQFYAFASFAVRQMAEGHWPLWNPHAYAGAPYWADIQAAVAYQPNLILFTAAAKLWGRLPFLLLELDALAHLMVAGVAAFLFARHHLSVPTHGGPSWYAPLLAALTFQLGGYLTGYPPLQLAILHTVAWLPLALLGVDRIVEGALRPGRNGNDHHESPGGVWRGAAGLGLAWGLILLAGHPQSAMQCLYLSLAYAAWRLWVARGVWKPSSVTRPLAGLASALALALGLSAAGWLPAAEFWRLSNRAAASYAQLGNGFPPHELFGAVLAGLTQWSPLYVGVLPLLLAIAGAWQAFQVPRHTRSGGDDGEAGPSGSPGRGGPFGTAAFARFWIGVLVVALFLSLGRNSFAFDLAYLLLPGFNLFRGQERAALAIAFALAMLAGCGALSLIAGGAGRSAKAEDPEATDSEAVDSQASASEPTASQVTGRIVALGAMGLAGLALVVMLVATADLRQFALRLLLAAGGTAVVAAVWRRNVGSVVLSLALLFVDLWSVGGSTNLAPSSPGELTVSPVLAALRTSSQRVENDHALPDNFGVLHGIDAVSGASPLRLATFDRLREGLADQPALLRQLLAVTDRVTFEADPGPGATEVLAMPEGASTIHLHRYELASPYAWPVHRAELAADDAEALARMKVEGFNPSSVVVLSTNPSALSPAEREAVTSGEVLGAATDASSVEFRASEVTVVSLAAHEVVAEMRSEAPGWLVFSEMAYPGWRATIDGQPTPWRRADVALMAVYVPAGGHRVALRFEAPLVGLGIAVSLASLILVLALLARGRWWSRDAVALGHDEQRLKREENEGD